MITKNDILESIRHEINICNHLYGKLTEDSLEYRPTPGQRSTIELLRYLSVIGIAATRSMIEKDWSVWGTYKARAEQMSAEQFPAMMDLQMDEIAAYVNGLSDEEFNTGTLKTPMGQEVAIDFGLVSTVLKWLTAYKMQLFLYAKATGSQNLTTSNCWAGVDMPPKPEVVEEPAGESAA
jgi:hypothetical protein